MNVRFEALESAVLATDPGTRLAARTLVTMAELDGRPDLRPRPSYLETVQQRMVSPELRRDVLTNMFMVRCGGGVEVPGSCTPSTDKVFAILPTFCWLAKAGDW